MHVSIFSTHSGAAVCTATAIILGLVLKAYWARLSNPRGLPLPPGPKRYPLLGNLLQFPKGYQWITFSNWSKEHGDIVYANVCGQGMLILNSSKAALDLLESRSAIYSDRPRFPMMELMGYEWHLTLMKYGPTWRLHRKTFNKHFNQAASSKYIQVLTDRVHEFLEGLTREPDGVQGHVQQFFSSSIFRIVYGLEIKDEDNENISLLVDAVEGAIQGGSLGTFLIDIIPILKYVPSWLPGAGFKKFARYHYDIQSSLRDNPIEAVQKAMATGKYSQSMVSELLAEIDDDTPTGRDTLEVIKNVAGVTFLAGSDTTVSTLRVFILAMALHPEIQEKAHQAICQVVGPHKLPEFSDLDSIPYLHAVVKELLRWIPVVPLGLPHQNTEHDEYNGYHIPKGCTVLANIWSILHDEREYPNPHSFQPERFLTPDGTLRGDVLDPLKFAFGFGRRACPGRYHAHNSVLIFIASILATFKITPSEDCALPKLDGTAEGLCFSLLDSGSVAHPRPFKVDVVPRSEIILEQLLKD